MTGENNRLALPDEPDTPGIGDVQDQLASLQEVERTEILTSLYGVAVTSPPPDTTFKIAVQTSDNSAYIVRYSNANGWEDIEEIPPSQVWDHHTLTTVTE